MSKDKLVKLDIITTDTCVSMLQTNYMPYVHHYRYTSTGVLHKCTATNT